MWLPLVWPSRISLFSSKNKAGAVWEKAVPGRREPGNLWASAGGALLSSARIWAKQLTCSLSWGFLKFPKGEEMTHSPGLGPCFLLPAWDAHPCLVCWVTAIHASRLRCQRGMLAHTCNPVLMGLTQEDRMFQASLGYIKRPRCCLA